MHSHMEVHLRGMARLAKPTEDKMLEILGGWDRLFYALRCDTLEQQRQEFDGIMRARLHSGVISIVAPPRPV